MIKFTLIIAAILYFSLGAEARGRIFEGDSDDNNEIKYTVSIHKRYSNQTIEYICSGAIIDKYFVLTAAHCIHNLSPKDLIVRSGLFDSKYDSTVFHEVMRLMYLKEYVNSSCRAHENDIALLKISPKFDLSNEENYSKLQLPNYELDYELNLVVFAGYGAENYEEHVNVTSNHTTYTFVYPEKHRRFETTVYPLEQCRSQSSTIVTEGHICTSNNEASGSSCIGDGGGPLVFEKTIIGIRTQHEECSENEPALYTRVSSYLGFIRNVLNHKFSYDIIYVF